MGRSRAAEDGNLGNGRNGVKAIDNLASKKTGPSCNYYALDTHFRDF